MGKRTTIGGGQCPSGHLLPAWRDLPASAGEGPDRYGQQHLQRLPLRRPLARQLFFERPGTRAFGVGRGSCGSPPDSTVNLATKGNRPLSKDAARARRRQTARLDARVREAGGSYRGARVSDAVVVPHHPYRSYVKAGRSARAITSIRTCRPSGSTSRPSLENKRL